MLDINTMCQYLLFTCALCVFLELSRAEVKTLGHPASPGQTWRSNKPSMWIDLATRLPPSIAVRWRLYSAVGHRPVRLQIWRPIVGTDDKFTLVAEHRVVPTSIGLHEYDLPVDSRVKIKQVDKLGFTNEMAEGPVAYSDTAWREADKLQHEHPDVVPLPIAAFTGSENSNMKPETKPEVDGDVGVMWAEVSMMPQVGSIYRMSHLEPERTFALNLDVVTCLESWSIVDTHCVQFVQSISNWTQAGDHCKRLGGHLVTPKSWRFASSLRRAMVLQGMAQTWLGLSYNDTTAYFTWMDDEGGEIYSMHQSAHGVPRSRRLCVALTHLGHWATVNCSHRTTFICQNNLGRPVEEIVTTLSTARQPMVIINSTTTPTGLSSSSTTTTSTTTTTTTTKTTTTITSSTSYSTPSSTQSTPSGSSQSVHQTPPSFTSSATITSTTKENCTGWPGKPCKMDNYNTLLSQMLQGQASAAAKVDVTILEAVMGSRRQHGITVHDLILLNGILDAMLDSQEHALKQTQTEQFIRSLADITDTVISTNCNCTDAWRGMRKLHEGPIDTARRLEGVLHNVLRHVTTSNSDVTVDVHNDGINVHMETTQRENVTIYRHRIEEEDIDIAIPNTSFQVLDDTKQLGISTMVFKQSERLVSLGLNKSDTDNTTLNSKVVSVTIYPPFNTDGTNTLVIKVPHLKPIDVRFQSPVCVFWDYRQEDWSVEGCRVTHYHQNATVCEFTHLTNFAVLMQSFDFEISPADRRRLSIVTYVGCSLSVFGLLATLLTLVVCRCFSERGRILINLCLALMSAYILFIFGIDRTNYTRVCKLVAVGLHYFYLSAFFWMLAQGIELYSKLRIVFMQRSKIIHYSIMGWGLPAVIVAVALAMRFDDYGRDEYCWLSLQTGLVWSFIGPVVIIVLVNFCVLCFVLNTFNQPRLGHKSHLRQHKSKSRRSAARAALILLPVLGLTWILGLLSVNEHTIMFQYLFAASNSSQGFLIFVLHCLLNEEVRSAWRHHLTRNRKHMATHCDSFRSDVKSVSTTNTGFSRQSPPPGCDAGGGVRYPKSILRPSSSCSSSSTTCTAKERACQQSSILSDSSLDSAGSVSTCDSAATWGTSTSSSSRKQRVRMLGLGYLLPGRSKSVVITDPKTAKRTLKTAAKMKLKIDKSTQKPG